MSFIEIEQKEWELYNFLFIQMNETLVSKHVTHPWDWGNTEDRFLHCTFLRLESKGVCYAHYDSFLSS